MGYLHPMCSRLDDGPRDGAGMAARQPVPAGRRPPSGRPRKKFTPANIQKIKEWVAQGMRREDIAKSLDVTVGLFKSHAHALDSVCEDVTMLRASASRAAPLFPMVGSMQREPTSRAKFQLVLKSQGTEQTTDLAFTAGHVGRLGVEASV